MNLQQIPKQNLIQKMDLKIVSWDYKAQDGEYVYTVYVGGEIPIRVKSNAITKQQLSRFC